MLFSHLDVVFRFETDEGRHDGWSSAVSRLPMSSIVTLHRVQQSCDTMRTARSNEDNASEDLPPSSFARLSLSLASAATTHPNPA